MPETATVPVYDPADPAHDEQRINALAHVLRQVALAPSGDGGDESWPRLCVWRWLDGTFSVDLVMPRRADPRSTAPTFYSGDPLMDQTWDGMEPRKYDTPEEAVRALLDNVSFRLFGPRPSPVMQQPRLPKSTEKLAVSSGGDDRF